MDREMRNYENGQDAINELLRQYEAIKSGTATGLLEEDAFVVIIDYYDELGRLSSALEAAAIGLEYFPFSSDLMVKKADLLIADRKYTDALDLLNEAFALNSNDVNIYILKMDTLLALHEEAQAEALFESGLEVFEGDERLELLFELSDVYDDYENFEKVFDCLVLILEQDPNNDEALYKICFWTDFTGRNEESIRLHNKIIDEYPYNELAWFNLAAAYQGLKLYEKAIDAYQYAVAINDKFDYAYRNMGDAYMRLRKYKEAIEVLQRVLELTRPEGVLYEAIGHCYHRLHDYSQARFHYRKASHLHPDDSKLHYKIALTYMDEQKWASAIKPLQTAMSIAHTPEFDLAMGECCLQLGDVKSAVQHFGLVVKQRPRNIPGWEALVRGLYIGGYYEEAGQQSEMALKATDGRPVFYFYHSMALFAEGKTKEALLMLETGMSFSPRLFKKVLELNPGILQNSKVVDILARYRRSRKI